MTKYADPIYPNIDDYKVDFWNNRYKITVSAQGFEFFVNADCLSDAIDIVIDYCEEKLPGLLFSAEEEEEQEFLDEYFCGGNHCRYFNTYNIRIEKL